MRALTITTSILLLLASGACADDSGVSLGDTVGGKALGEEGITTDPAGAPAADQLPSGAETDRASVVAGSFADADLGEPYIGPLRFDPPSNCSVPVEETVVDRGATGVLSYELAFADEGEHVVVSWEEMRILEMNGQAVPVSQQDALAVMFQMPSIVVDATGRAVEVRGVEQVIETMSELVPGSEQLTGRPELVAMMEESVLDRYWGTWVGVWVDWGRFDEAEELGVVDNGWGEPSQLVMTSVGTTSDGLAGFRAESSVDGPEALQALTSLFGSIGLDVSDEELRDEVASWDVRLDDLVEVVTDPRTLRPRSVMVQRTIQARTGGQKQTNVDRRTSVLHWDASTCG